VAQTGKERGGADWAENRPAWRFGPQGKKKRKGKREVGLGWKERERGRKIFHFPLKT
jgi:hypothetical protein